MDANKLDTFSKDAISCLPQEVLGHILSSVPTKLAASTSVLSKKWRNVFALVHNLDFDDSDLLQPEEWEVKREMFKSFVDRTLALQSASPIKKFSLKHHILEESEMASHVGGWIRNAVERGVMEMSLILKSNCQLSLPCALFTSKTLVKLTLGSQLTLGDIPPGVSLPALKTLFIDSVFFTFEDLCNVFLPGCPVLEEMSVHHEDYEGVPFCISSQSIKKLSVHYNFESEIDSMPGMSFEAPNLVSLDYSDYALEEYPQVDLESLVEARLDIKYSKIINRPDLTGLIDGISNVETLHLTPASADVISRCVKHGLVLPVFKNLVSLSFGSGIKRDWKVLPYLIKRSPKLETLIIQGLDGYVGDGTKHLLHVKVLHVLGYGGTANELEHLKSFLAGVNECLELVQVEFAEGVTVDDGTMLQTHRDLMTQLVGVKCKAQVTFFK
ncbi:F-box family protein [Raphanus sativus]|uniref:F-box/LRR-repeat protein At3g60040-like n=1 Tax=Raphanus sativus TaxID=3726 RepID=A0A9W3DNP0_RAPSA|nr:F-box/LRR-repeat protein At3g60040-like [Raphanus sativus]KAJ4904982.1 F-box family protein [Raphanus sativus]